ncbi:MAG: hypothetical protein AB7E72_05465 [Lysobacterales bacterium]
MLARIVFIAAIGLGTASASAADYAPGSQITLQGTVSGLESPRTFWLDVDGDRILVYGTSAQRARMYRGLKVRVEGSISDDYIRLADIELQARRIEVVRGDAATTAAALQQP